MDGIPASHAAREKHRAAGPLQQLLDLRGSPSAWEKCIKKSDNKGNNLMNHLMKQGMNHLTKHGMKYGMKYGFCGSQIPDATLVKLVKALESSNSEQFQATPLVSVSFLFTGTNRSLPRCNFSCISSRAFNGFQYFTASIRM